MYVWDDKKKQYVSDTPASRIPVKDSAELFESNNVEGALAELAGERDAQSITLQDHTGKIENLQENVDWLKVNGGGSGGGGAGGIVMPTITTSDELNQIVPKGQEIVINVFFASPNLGGGALIVLINNKEAGSYTIKQGMNTINLGKLDALRNKIVVYAKDRANLMSNDLTYNIINGGVSLTLDFDYYADYPADKDILMRYTIDTDQTDIQLDVTVDNNKSSVTCKNGYNEYYFKNLTVGIHAVTVKAVSGQFISETYSFNLVVINSDSLYISSTFGENPTCTLGVPVIIDYRISYKDDTAVTIVLTLDGEVNKTLTSKRGSYAWTLNDMTLGSHSYKIDCTLGADTVSLEGTFVVEQGAYTPLQINKDGLRYQMGCATRTNRDDDKEQFIYDNGTSQITTTLHGFNFETNGWINGALLCTGGAYAEIDYACMADNAPYGLTVEIDFKATDTGVQNAKVLECRDASTNKGFHVALREAMLNSISNEARVYITPDERTTVSLQIDRQDKFAKIYVNGIITSAFKLSDSGSGVSAVLENFMHEGKIYVGCDKDLGNNSNCEIYDIRVYARKVPNDEIVKNVIAQESDLQKQEELFNFCFNNNTLPTMRLYSDEVENKVENMTQFNKITMRAVYTSTNTEKYGQPFELKYCKVYWQGTSSLDFIRKNYNIELYDDDLKEYYYSPYQNGVQEYLFCLKCDYMESSHARNVGIGNLINKYWYTSKNPAQLKDEMVQNAVQGFPMLLYVNDEFMGVYNFNTDRYSNASFGYTGDSCLAYEVSANSDTTAGAFFQYDATKHEGNELDYYKSDFMCLYPPTRRAGNDTMNEIISLVKFVDKSSDEEFVTNINNNVYFNKEYLLRYLIYCLVMGAVDSLGKNMKLATWDNGTTWYPQIYDCDTTMGLNNEGVLAFTESNMKIEAGTYNTSSSRLWSRLIELMWADIQAEYTKMRNTTLTLENIYECVINNEMDLIPATYYNSDCETKYLQFGSSFLKVLHGQGKQQVMEWLRARLLYVDTYMEYWVTTSDYVKLRSSKQGDVYIDLEMFDNMYAQIKWRNTGNADDAQAIQIKEVKKGEVTRFTFKSVTATDQEIRIYGGKYIKSLGELSNLAPTTIEIANAPRLTEVVCHSENLKTIDLSSCTNLRKVDLKDCTGLGIGDQTTKTLEVINCGNIKYVNCQNTQLQGVHLNPKGSNIKEVWYPKSVQVVTFSNCPQLEVIGLEQGHSCKELTLTNCPSVTTFGDLEYNKSVSENTYSNGWFLSGVQKINLDNSMTALKNLEILYPIGLISVTVKNMPKLQSIKLGVNSPVDYTTKDNVHGTYDYIGNISKLNDVTIKAINTPKLKTLYTTGIGRKSCDTPSWMHSVYMNTDYETYLGVSKGNYVNKAGNFRCKILDLSETPIENLYLYIPTEVLGVKIPTTIKGIRVSHYFDYLDNYKGNSFEKYLYMESPGNLGVASNGDATLANSAYVWCSPISAPYLVPNIWCNTASNADYEPAFDEPTWNFDGLGEVEVFSTDVYPKGLGSNTFYSTIGSIKNNVMNYTLKNAKIKGTTYAMSLCMFTALENVSLDYSAFNGVSLNYAYSNITQDVTVKVPTNLGSVKYYDAVLLNAKNNGIAWNDKLTLMFLNNLIDCTGSNGMVLKEQTDYDTDGIVINNTRNNYGSWFKNSNIKYIKEFNNKQRTNPSILLACASVERIGTLDISGTREGTGIIITTDCKALNRIDLIKLPNKTTATTITNGFNKLHLGYPVKITGANLTGTNMFRDASFKSLDLSEFTFNGVLEYAFYGSTIQEGSLVMKGICTNLHSTFEGASVPTLDITELNISGCTSMRGVFSRVNIGNLLGLPATIPNTVTACSSMFDASNITQATPNVIPTFEVGSNCTTVTQMCYNVKGGALQVPSVYMIPPKVTGDFLNLFNGDVKMPETFTLDFSKMEYLLNPTGGGLNLIRSNDIKDLKIILPPYTYNKTVGTEADTTLQAFLCVSGTDNLTNLRFDLSKYKGTKLGTTYFLGDKKIANLTIDNLDLNVMDMQLVHNSNPVFIKDFTVAKQVNSRDVKFLARTRMAYETYLKVVTDALAELDCASLLMPYTFAQDARYKVIHFVNPRPNDGTVRFRISVSAKVSKYMNANKTSTSTDYGMYFLYKGADGTSYNGGGWGAWAPSTGEAFSASFTFTRGSGTSKYVSKGVQISPNKFNVTIDQLNAWVKSGDISLTYDSSSSTPKTVTFGTLTNYAGSTSLTTAQKENLTLKGIAKGWNVVFV